MNCTDQNLINLSIQRLVYLWLFRTLFPIILNNSNAENWVLLRVRRSAKLQNTPQLKWTFKSCYRSPAVDIIYILSIYKPHEIYTCPVTYSSTTGLRTAVAVKLYTYPIHLPNNLFIHYGTADRGSTYIIHRIRVRVRV